jgi:hypothetical protein
VLSSSAPASSPTTRAYSPRVLPVSDFFAMSTSVAREAPSPKQRR